MDIIVLAVFDESLFARSSVAWNDFVIFCSFVKYTEVLFCYTVIVCNSVPKCEIH